MRGLLFLVLLFTSVEAYKYTSILSWCIFKGEKKVDQLFNQNTLSKFERLSIITSFVKKCTEMDSPVKIDSIAYFQVIGICSDDIACLNDFFEDYRI
jgi:hypothetical protein